VSVALVEVGRLAPLVGRSTDDAAVFFAVELAESLVESEVGNRLTNPPQPGVAAVAVQVAARLLAGPVGVASESEGGTAFTYKPGAGEVALLPDERAALRRAVGRGSGLGQIALISPGVGTWRFDPGPAPTYGMLRRSG
jgi:hypothetical protein